MSIYYNVNQAIITRFYTFWLSVSVLFRLSRLTTLTVIQHVFLHGILILTDWLDQTSNISILSYEHYTLALPPTHIIVGLPQMDGVAQWQFMM